MSGRTALVIVLIPLALALPAVLVKLVVRDGHPMLPVELLHPYEVVTVEYYGIRLDEKASPRDVVYALLRSVEASFAAAEAPTRREQVDGLRRAREIQLALAAPETILASCPRSAIGENERVRQEFILRTVLTWSRMLGYYIGGMGTDRRDAWQESIDKSAPSQPARATVRFEARKNEFKTQVIVQLAKESDRWRIYRVSLAPAMAKLPRPVRRAVPTQPVASQPTPRPATRAKPKVLKLPTRPSTRPKTRPVTPKPAEAVSKPAKRMPPATKAKQVSPATRPKPTQSAPKKPPSKVATAPAPSSRAASKPTTTRAVK